MNLLLKLAIACAVLFLGLGIGVIVLVQESARDMSANIHDTELANASSWAVPIMAILMVFSSVAFVPLLIEGLHRHPDAKTRSD